jgi:hypothetical protein
MLGCGRLHASLRFFYGPSSPNIRGAQRYRKVSQLAIMHATRKHVVLCRKYITLARKRMTTWVTAEIITCSPRLSRHGPWVIVNARMIETRLRDALDEH